MSQRRGLTLLEVVIASLVASIVAGGTLMAFVASTRMTAGQDLMSHAEASALAQETIERYRNEVATTSNWLQDQDAVTLNNGWVTDPNPLPAPAAGGTESVLNQPDVRRCYRVRAEDCDGDAVPGDCYAVQSQVCWTPIDANCHCPPS